MLSLLWNQFGKALLTLVEVATVLGVSLDGVKELISKGKLQVMNAMTEPMVSLQVLADFMCATPTNSPTTIDKLSGVAVTSQTKKEEVLKVHKIKVYHSPLGSKEKCKYTTQLYVDGKVVKSKRVMTKKEGEAWAKGFAIEQGYIQAEQEEQIEGAKKLSGNPSFAEYAEFVLAVGFGSGSSVTKKGYYDAAKQVVKEIGNVKVRDLNFDIIKMMFNKFAPQYMQGTIDKQFIVLNQVLSRAYKDRYLSEDIMRMFYAEGGKHNNEYPRSQKFKEGVEAFSKKEVGMLLEAAESYPEVYPIFVMFLNSGARPSELRGMQWSNLNLESKTITIKSRIVNEYEELSLDGRSTPVEKSKLGVKTSRAKRAQRDRGVREIPLSDKTIQVMLEWREYVQNNPEYEYFKDSPYIFPSRESEFMSYSAMKSRVNRFLKSSGVGKKLHYSAYRFRHTFCTNLALSGAPLALTMQLMGDKSSDIVLNVYTNISSQQAVDEARKYCII